MKFHLLSGRFKNLFVSSERNLSTHLKKIAPKLNSKTISIDNNLDTSTTRPAKLVLSSAQIEQYKRQLYDLIKQKRDHTQVNEFTKFLTEGCEPSLHLFNIILKGQLMMRNVEGIKETLLLIAKNNFAFNAVTLNLLLVYYRELDMMEEAEKLFKAMESRKTDANPLINCAGPNLSAFTTMIAGWTRRGDYARCKKYYDAISSKENDLVPDEHATCALLNAAVGLGHLEDAKNLYESIVNKSKNQPGFVAQKLWLRATFRIGGYEDALMKLLEMNNNENCLELGELIKWIISDVTDEKSMFKVALHVFNVCLEKEVRIGDPRCLHSLLDTLKKDEDTFVKFGRLCLQWSVSTLPILGGRLLHQLVQLNQKSVAKEVVTECNALGVPLPSGLLLDYSQKFELTGIVKMKTQKKITI